MHVNRKEVSKYASSHEVKWWYWYWNIVNRIIYWIKVNWKYIMVMDMGFVSNVDLSWHRHLYLCHFLLNKISSSYSL